VSGTGSLKEAMMRINRSVAVAALAGCFWFSQVGAVRASECTPQSSTIESCCDGTSAIWKVSAPYGYEMCDVEQEVIDGYCESVCADCGSAPETGTSGTCEPAHGNGQGESRGTIGCVCIPIIE
jgi:hypothetical protein